MKNKIFLLLFFFVSTLFHPCISQQGYVIVSISASTYLSIIDFNTCEICIISDALDPVARELTMLPNGNFIGIINGMISVYGAPPAAQSLYVNDPPPGGSFFFASTYDPTADIVYLMANDGLYTFDYTSYALNLIGPWPSSWIGPGSLQGIHFTNGQLYGIGPTTAMFDADLFTIDITNPANSLVIASLESLGFPGTTSGSSPNGFYYNDVGGGKGEFDLATQTWTQLCPYIPPYQLGSLSFPTFTLPDYPCIPLCFTEAGIMPANLITECVSEVAEMNNASGVSFQSDDLLQYILFTDENDTLNTIIATSNTPNFAFDPNTMTVNTIYYVTSIVGDNDGTGNVDLNDPCLDIGENAQRLRFVPEPSVTFSVANNDICENGCKEINASFTGNPPFILTYQVGNDPEVSQTFNTTNGNFEICIGAETGSIDLKATDLSDAVCCGG